MKKLYIQMHSLHGLLRSKNIELGQDEDTGGQIIYVLELAKHLAKQPNIKKVDILTRLIKDKNHQGYDQKIEKVAPKVNIIRIPAGPNQYLKKTKLWPHLNDFIQNWEQEFKNNKPDILHSNFADSGFICLKLSTKYKIPQVHTGHALEKFEIQRLTQNQHINQRRSTSDSYVKNKIKAEQDIINHAQAIIVSSKDEKIRQYGLYNIKNQSKKFYIIPPGIDYKHFFPYTKYSDKKIKSLSQKIIKTTIDKPLVIVINRLDIRKNIPSIVKAFSQSEKLKNKSYLYLALGPLSNLTANQKRILQEIKSIIKTHQLKNVKFIEKLTRQDVADLYRLTAFSHGVFVNPASVEPFGLTTLESASCGAPVVATKFGGTAEIIKKCKNGLAIDPFNAKQFTKAIESIIFNQPKWQTYSKNGIKNAPKFYSWPKASLKESELFKKLKK